MNYTVQPSQLSPPKVLGCNILAPSVVKDIDLGCQLRQLGRLLTAMEASNLESSRTATTCIFWPLFSGTLRWHVLESWMQMDLQCTFRQPESTSSTDAIGLAEACQTSCGGDVNLWTPYSLMLGAVGAVALGISTPTRCIFSVRNLLQLNLVLSCNFIYLNLF